MEVSPHLHVIWMKRNSASGHTVLPVRQVYDLGKTFTVFRVCFETAKIRRRRSCLGKWLPILFPYRKSSGNNISLPINERRIRFGRLKFHRFRIALNYSISFFRSSYSRRTQTPYRPRRSCSEYTRTKTRKIDRSTRLHAVRSFRVPFVFFLVHNVHTNSPTIQPTW